MSTPATRREDHASSSLLPRVEAVVLIVHDLPRIVASYESVIGLHRLRAEEETVTLGAGETALIELRCDASARRARKREVGYSLPLADIRVRTPDAPSIAGGGVLVDDPWGTRFRLMPTRDSEESKR